MIVLLSKSWQTFVTVTIVTSPACGQIEKRIEKRTQISRKTSANASRRPSENVRFSTVGGLEIQKGRKFNHMTSSSYCSYSHQFIMTLMKNTGVHDVHWDIIHGNCGLHSQVCNVLVWWLLLESCNNGAEKGKCFRREFWMLTPSQVTGHTDQTDRIKDCDRKVQHIFSIQDDGEFVKVDKR